MTLTEHTYVDTVWFVPGEMIDWLATLFREGDGPWKVEYRFRYYHPETRHGDAFAGKDKKNQYRWTAKDASEEAMKALKRATNLVADKMARDWHTAADVIPIHGGIEAFEKKLAKKSWSHIRVSATPPTRPQ